MGVQNIEKRGRNTTIEEERPGGEGRRGAGKRKKRKSRRSHLKNKEEKGTANSKGGHKKGHKRRGTSIFSVSV